MQLYYHQHRACSVTVAIRCARVIFCLNELRYFLLVTVKKVPLPYLSSIPQKAASDYKTAGDQEHKLHSGQWDWHSYVLKGRQQEAFREHCPITAVRYGDNNNYPSPLWVLRVHLQITRLPSALLHQIIDSSSFRLVRIEHTLFQRLEETIVIRPFCFILVLGNYYLFTSQ